MSKNPLKFNNNEVNKKEFYASKQSISLNLVNVNQILISDKFEHSGKGFKYFIDYKNDNTVGPLCIILPQMSGYIKYFDNGRKNVSLMIEGDSVLIKYNKISNHKTHSMSNYDKKYIKTKAKKINDVGNAKF